MKTLIYFLCLTYAISAVARSSDWFELKSEIILKNKATVFGNKKSNVRVLHQVNDIKPIFSDLKKETKHQCKILQKSLKGSMKILNHEKLEYCLIDPQNIILFVTGKKENRKLHQYQFTNATQTDQQSFLRELSFK